MTLLGIDTATSSAGVALWGDDGPMASARVVGGRKHAEVVMPLVQELCERTGTAVGDIGAVAVDIGPGLFTGLRVGLATATAIGLARNVPVVGVSSLDVLANPHRRRAGRLTTVVDARRGAVYWALYETDGRELHQLQAPAVAPPEAVAASLAGSPAPVLAVGDGAWRYRELMSPVAEVAGPGEMWPSAEVVAELGAARLAGGVVPDRPPRPLYLRKADVRIGWDQVDGRVGEVRAAP